VELAEESAIMLPAMSVGEQVMEDYAALRLSLKAHPLALLRAELAAEKVAPAVRLARMKNGVAVTVAGLVICRQRPGTAAGVIFATLEDETGVANIVVWADTFERYRRAVVGARLLKVTGRLQIEGRVIHVIAGRIDDISQRLNRLHDPGSTAEAAEVRFPSHDFH
jgi:error-prone DNA polymerase